MDIDNVNKTLDEIKKERQREARRRYKAKNKEKLLAQQREQYHLKKNDSEFKRRKKEYRLKYKHKATENYKIKLEDPEYKKIRLEQNKKSHLKNKFKYKKNKYVSPGAKLRRALKRQAKADFVNEFKSSKGCSLCGWNKFSEGLDLHHIKGTKEFSLGHARNKSIEKIREELNKCVVVCATCHRGIHAGILSLPDLTLIEHEHQKHKTG